MPYDQLPFPSSTATRRGAALLACLFFAACGGGGSGGSSTPGAPVVAAPPASACGAGTTDYMAAGDEDMAALGITCMQSVRAGKETVLQIPNGMALDKAGNTYILDRAKQVIFKLTPAGAMSVLAGSIANYGSQDGAGSAASFNFNHQSRIIVDTAGNLIVTDTCNNTLRKITPGGVVSTLAGVSEQVCWLGAGVLPTHDGAGAQALFTRPAEIVLDVNGDYLVIEQLGIRRVTPAGVVSHVFWTNDPKNERKISGPSRIAVAGDGSLYVVESARIYRISGGLASFIAGGDYAKEGGVRDGTGAAASFKSPRALAVDAAGDVYVSDYDTLRKVTPRGVVTTIAGDGKGGDVRDGKGTEARFSYISQLLINSSGNVLALDTGAPAIRTITPGGAVTTSAATPVTSASVDGKGSAARFNRRDGTAADAAGNLYIADYSTNLVRMVSPDGVVSVFAGNGVKGAVFAHPYSIAVGLNGTVYVVDSERIARIDGGATTTVLPHPVGGDAVVDIAVDPEGSVAVAGYYSVSQVSSSGKVTQLIADAGTGPRDPNNFSFQPASIAYDRLGNLYVADDDSKAVYKYSKDGKLTLFAGSPGWIGDRDGPVRTAMLGFHGTTEMAFAPNGDMYLSGQGLLRKVKPDGTVSTPALAWGKPVLGGIAIGNGMLIGMTGYAVLHTALPAD
ncbi:DPP IV N-terminal domain-containing protein [Massilia sp. P8910]|uniref:DPP IV N-terminal domain-containing protein n=1 Tax=Massilia antarctica TaxID=2765360 RepID=UPI001E5646E7|nr:DPP IV N-terminal domain-containing protein [Massilia antarctica]MCE3606533.1 DPP IV N-terminal domain-containing protein [Massilia antarctica]